MAFAARRVVSQAARRRLSSDGKPVLRSTLCWGDTSAAWDWAARTLTLSDGATTVLAENVDGFAELWRRNQLVLRKHGVAFDWSHKALHNSVDTVDVRPRCTRVGTTSWAFASDFWDANEKERVATTRGVFVHVKEGRPEPLPEKVAAGLRELVTEDDCDDPFPGSAAMDALAWAEGADGGGDYVVRQSDADSLGHINNARWAHILYDARLHAIDAERQEGKWKCRHVNAFDVEYIREVKPGSILRWTSSVAAYGARVARRFEFFFDEGGPCTVVHMLESTIESEAWVGFLNGDEP